MVKVAIQEDPSSHGNTVTYGPIVYIGTNVLIFCGFERDATCFSDGSRGFGIYGGIHEFEWKIDVCFRMVDLQQFDFYILQFFLEMM